MTSAPPRGLFGIQDSRAGLDAWCAGKVTVRPEDIAAAVISGLANGAEEILADDRARRAAVKGTLVVGVYAGLVDTDMAKALTAARSVSTPGQMPGTC